MAGNFFEMGVAVRIKNHKFRFPARQATTFASDEAAGQTILSVIADLTKYLQRGDTVILGESTDAADSGKSETAIVASVASGPNTVTIKSPGTIYIYDSGDPFKAYGTKFSNNWTFDSDMNPQTITPSGGGNSDRYAMYGIGTNNQLSYIDMEFDNLLLESVYYRCGLYYKYTLGGGGVSALQITLNDGTSSIILLATIAPTTHSTWDRYASSAAQTAADLSNVGFLRIYSDDASSNASSMWIDDVFLEHADEINSLGFYTFTDFPNASSLAYDLVDLNSNVPVSPNLLKRIKYGYGDKTKRWWIRCRFSFAPQADWDAIQTLLDWQDRGNLLNLHPFITDLPGVMTGYLDVKRFGKPEFDFGLRSFNFEFVEAVV